MLKLLAKVLKVLNSQTDPLQISLGITLAMVAGFTPLLSLHNLLVLLLLTVLRANLSTFLVALPLWASLGYLLDPLFHRVGYGVLTASPLAGFWASLYNTIPGRLERVNNTMVTGSLLVSILLAVPVLLLSGFLIRRYRQHILEKVKQSRVMQALAASKFVQLYRSVSSWGGE